MFSFPFLAFFDVFHKSARVIPLTIPTMIFLTSLDHLDYFKCKSQGNCIPMEWAYDGKIQCSDASDEDKGDSNLNRRVKKFRSKHFKVQSFELCVKPFIQCAHITNPELQICAKTCDQIRECNDSIDERVELHDCPIYFTSKNVTPEETDVYIEPPNFPKNYFNNARETWYVHLDDGYFLNLKLEQFQLEKGCIDRLVMIKGIVPEEELKVSH